MARPVAFAIMALDSECRYATMMLDPRDQLDSTTRRYFIRWAAISAAYAVLAGVVLYGLLYALKEAFGAASSFPRWQIAPGGRGPATLVLITSLAFGWGSAILAERTWGCTGWQLAISVGGSALIFGVVAALLVRATFGDAATALLGSCITGAVVFAAAGGFAVYWRA